MSTEKMSDRDILVEMRTEMKLHTKVLYAIVGAIIGVKFIPQSPIDIVEATTFGLRFLLIMVGIFVVLRIWEFRGRVKPAFVVAILSFIGMVGLTIVHEYTDGAVLATLNVLRGVMLVSLFFCAKDIDKYSFAFRAGG